MNYIYLLVSSIIILICFYCIVSPFFAPKKDLSVVKNGSEDSLTLETIYSVVNELEMDLLMKKITEEDFQRLKNSYHRLAVEMKEREKKSPVKAIEDEQIEQEILAELQEIRSRKENEL